MVENKTAEELASEEVATKDTAAEEFKKKEKAKQLDYAVGIAFGSGLGYHLVPPHLYE